MAESLQASPGSSTTALGICSRWVCLWMGREGATSIASRSRPATCTSLPAGPETAVNSSRALAYDGTANIYVASYNGLAQVNLQAGSVASVSAFSGTSFMRGQGIAIDAAHNLYAAQQSTIVSYPLTGGAVSVLAGSSPGSPVGASFLFPRQLAFDGQNTLYVADGQDDYLRAIDVTSGAVSTLATVSNPTGIALDGQGSLLAACLTSSDVATVVRVALDGGAVTNVATGVGTSPGFVAYDGLGNLYVDDLRTLTLSSVALATGTVTALDAGAQGLAAGAGVLYLIQGTKVVSWNPATGATSPVASGFIAPFSLAFDGNQGLYVADDGDATVRLIDLDGGSVSLAVGTPYSEAVVPGPLPAVLNQPSGLAVGPGGTLFIADQVENAILEVR